MIVNASSNRETRWSNGKPKAANSVSFQPAPRPRIKRPPLISSTVLASFASIAGVWKAVAATSGPSRIRDVLAAMAASIVQTSHGPRAEPSDVFFCGTRYPERDALLNGVDWWGFAGMTSCEHTDAVIEHTVSAFEASVEMLRAEGLG